MIHKTKNPWCNCNAYIWYVKVTRMCLHTRKMTNCVFSYVASRFSFITNLLLLEYFFFFSKNMHTLTALQKGSILYFEQHWKKPDQLCIICWFLKRKGEKKFKKKQGNNKKKARKHTLDSMVLGFLFVILHTYSNFFLTECFFVCVFTIVIYNN